MAPAPRRDAFLVRLDPVVLEALRRWADDDLRSVNAQVEFLLRRCLRESGRLGGPDAAEKTPRRGRPPRE
jgi:hypothetical protein